VRAAYARRAVDQRYSWFDRANLWLVQQRESGVLDALRRNGVQDLSQKIVLDVGCGHGQWLGDFIKWGVQPQNLTGIDLLPERVAAARARLPQQVCLHVGSASELPARSASCDIVVQSTMFSSILDQQTRQRVATEMLRVLRADGLIVWYDFFLDNPRNSDVKGVRKSDIRALFPQCVIDLRRATLAPPIARRIAPISRLGCSVLESLPILRTHYLGVIRRAP